MMPRPRRILALTRRELAQDLKGRRWISVPALLVALLLPASTLPSTLRLPTQDTWVTGDVPAEVLTVDDVVVEDNFAALRFDGSDPAQLRITGPGMPRELRDTLDAVRPEGRVAIEQRRPPSQLPRRGLLLALLAASGLTASIASSIGTERSRRTLTTLLSAAITPLEIVLGKLIAWGGMATVSTLLFTGVALLRGVMEPGWWMLPVAVTPGVTVALGLWSVRSAPDVVSATTTALRVMPVVTMVAAVSATALGNTDPLLGALVPLGGVICTAGEMWTEHPARDALVASASALLAGLGFVLHTARTLTEHPASTPPDVGWTAVPAPAGLLLLTTFCTMVAPALWGLAGNAAVTADVTPESAALVAAGCMGVGFGALALRHTGGHPFLHLPVPPPLAWVGAAAGALFLAACDPILGLAADQSSLFGILAHGFHLALVPRVGAVAALALIASEELLFRGVLAPRMGHGPAAAAWAIAKAPLDPVAALLAGSAVGLVGRAGGAVASFVLRAAWWLLISLP